MNALKSTTIALAASLLTGSASLAQTSSAYVHHALPGTITSSKTILDTAVLNGNSTLQLLATHNINAGSGAGVLVDKKMGFRFQSYKWYLFHQDLTSFTPNTHYNIFIPGTDVEAWKHTTAAANISGNYTIIDDARLNGKPNELFFVSDVLGNYNTKILGVFYLTASQKWCIYNQHNVDAMDQNLEFNIIVPKPAAGFATAVHTADANNTSNHFTYINHPDLNNNPNAIIFLTQVWNPGGINPGTYNNHNVGVQYDTNNHYWRIVNEDLANIPIGASFNMMIFKNNNSTSVQKLAADAMKMGANPVTTGAPIHFSLGASVSGKVQISVCDLSGKLLLRREILKTQTEQPVSLPSDGMAPGAYLIQVSHEGKMAASTLIIQ